MATNPLAPDPLTDIDGPPLIEPDYNEPARDPYRDPDSGQLPQDEPEDEEPEEDSDDEPLAYYDGLEEPVEESDVEIDDAIFRRDIPLTLN